MTVAVLLDVLSIIVAGNNRTATVMERIPR